jgi:type III secretory pathway component EscS
MDAIIEALKPVQQQTIDFSVAAVGILSTLACFVPKDSKLGKLLQSAIKSFTNLGKKFKK